MLTQLGIAWNQDTRARKLRMCVHTAEIQSVYTGVLLQYDH